MVIGYWNEKNIVFLLFQGTFDIWNLTFIPKTSKNTEWTKIDKKACGQKRQKHQIYFFVVPMLFASSCLSILVCDYKQAWLTSPDAYPQLSAFEPLEEKSLPANRCVDFDKYK